MRFIDVKNLYITVKNLCDFACVLKYISLINSKI